MPKKMPKNATASSQSQRSVRIHDVYKMLCEGYATAEIYDVIQDKHGVKDEAVKKYIHEARKLLHKRLDADKESSLQSAIALRETLISKMIRSGQLAAAAQALMDKNKLENLYESADVEQNVTIKIVQ